MIASAEEVSVFSQTGMCTSKENQSAFVFPGGDVISVSVNIYPLNTTVYGELLATVLSSEKREI